MPYVLTVDQIDSRRSADLVGDALTRLHDLPARLPFTRTAGDEFQGLLDQALSVVGVIVILMRTGDWHIGLGIGSVAEPLPSDDPRSARGDAFLAARAAVERAKTEPSHLAVATTTEGAVEAVDVETVFRLLGAVSTRRSAAGWQVVDLLSQGLTQSDAAARLHISRQAVGQRAQTAHWSLERSATPTLVRLLDRAERSAP